MPKDQPDQAELDAAVCQEWVDSTRELEECISRMNEKTRDVLKMALKVLLRKLEQKS